MRKNAVCLGVVALLLLGACSSDDGNDAATASKVTIKTSEYKFEVPASFGGGLVEITLDNSTGKESHEAELMRLDEGKTLADLQAAMQAEGPPPEWVHEAGGPGPVLPGASAVYTGNLTAGTYVMVCHVPAPDGKAHLDKGMVAQTTVTAGDAGTIPTGDVSLSTKEFQFVGTDALKAGKQTVFVKNEGAQAHHVAIFALAPEKTVDDALAFFAAAAEGKAEGPPPFTGAAGLTATFAPGMEASRTLELTAGTTYGFACFIPDTDGTPHAFKGMKAQITV